MALPGAAAAAVGAGAGRGWTAGDLALAVADVADRLGQYAFRRGDLHLYRLLAVGTLAAGSYRRAGGAVRAAGAVRRRRGLQRRIRRNFWAIAAGRHDHRGRRHRRDAVVEAFARAAEDRVSAQ